MDHGKREIALCASSFTHFLTLVKVLDPRRGVVSWETHDYHERLHKAYDEHRFVISRKIRQAGITTHALLYLLWKSLFRLDKNVVVFCNTTREAVACKDMVKRCLHYLPEFLNTGVEFDKNKIVVRDNNSTIHFLRYGEECPENATEVLLDEAAFNLEMQAHWELIFPKLAANGRVIVLSTTNGKKNRKGYLTEYQPNWFYETYRGAIAKQNEFHPFDFVYSEIPFYTNEVVEQVKIALGEVGFRQEVLAQFVEEGKPDRPTSKGLEIEDREVDHQAVCVKEDPEASKIWTSKMAACGEVVERIVEQGVNPQDLDEKTVVDKCINEPQPDLRKDKELLDRVKSQTPEELAKKYAPHESEEAVLDECFSDRLKKKPHPVVHDFKQRSPEEVKKLFTEDHERGGKTVYSNGVNHPYFPKDVKWSEEEMAEIWNDLAQHMPQYKDVAKEMQKVVDAKKAHETAFFERVDVPFETLKLAGVIPEEARECEDCENDYRCKLLKEIVNEELPINMTLGLTEDSLCVNGVPTKISGRGIEYLFLGLLELEGEEKALTMTAKIVRKKLKKLF